MPLITDNDILSIDPAVFIDAADQGLTLFEDSGADLTGTSLTKTGVDFTTLNLDEHGVAVAGVQVLEILSVDTETELSVSKPRPADGTVIEPDTGAGLSLTIITFEQRIDDAENHVRRTLWLDPDDPIDPVEDDAILNIDQIARLVALRTLSVIYRRAAAADPTSEALASKASLYQQLEQAARHQTAAVLDLNGDAQPDAVRRFDVVTMTRR